MPRPNLANLLDSDSDDSLVANSGSFENTGKMAASKKTKSRANANRVSKPEPKAATRRADAKKAVAIEQELERQALADKPTNQKAKSGRGRKAKATDDTKEEEDEDAGNGADVLATPPGSDEPVRAKAGRGRPRKDAVVPESVQKATNPAKSKKGGRKAVEAEESAPEQEEPSAIPETQDADLMDVDAEEQDQVEDLPTFSRFSAPPSVSRGGTYFAPPSASKRPGSSSSHESDSSLRRRLGEMTKKYEALEAKYKDLRNVAVTEAEKTFDRLKKTTEEKTQSMLPRTFRDAPRRN